MCRTRRESIPGGTPRARNGSSESGATRFDLRRGSCAPSIGPTLKRKYKGGESAFPLRKGHSDSLFACYCSNQPVGEFGDVVVSMGDGIGAAHFTALHSTRAITGS